MTIAILLGVFIILLIFNVPIALCVGMSAISMFFFKGMKLSPVASNFYTGVNKFVLLAIPFFVMAGNVMERAGISGKLIAFAKSLVNRFY